MCNRRDPTWKGVLVDKRQSLLLIRACDSIAGYFGADVKGAQEAVKGAQEALTAFQPILAEAAEAFSYFAATIAGVAASSGGMSPGEFIVALPQQQIQVLPDTGVDWDAAVSVAKLVADGEPVEIVRTQGLSMDVPTAINSCFSVAVSAVLVISALTSRLPTDWISIVRQGADNPGQIPDINSSTNV